MNLRGYFIDDHGAGLLAPKISSNTSVRKLFLGGNKITDIGVAVLAAALAHNNALLYLHIGDNKTADDGACALGKDFPNHYPSANPSAKKYIKSQHTHLPIPDQTTSLYYVTLQVRH